MVSHFELPNNPVAGNRTVQHSGSLIGNGVIDEQSACGRGTAAKMP